MLVSAIIDYDTVFTETNNYNQNTARE